MKTSSFWPGLGSTKSQGNQIIVRFDCFDYHFLYQGSLFVLPNNSSSNSEKLKKIILHKEGVWNLHFRPKNQRGHTKERCASEGHPWEINPKDNPNTPQRHPKWHIQSVQTPQTLQRPPKDSPKTFQILLKNPTKTSKRLPKDKLKEAPETPQICTKAK